jgi:hypothetical protein
MATIIGALLDEDFGSSLSSSGSAVDHLAGFPDFAPFLGTGLDFSLDFVGVGLGPAGAGGSGSAMSSAVPDVAGCGSGASRSILASGPSVGAIPDSNMTVAAGFEAVWIIELVGTGSAGSSMFTSMPASGAGRGSAGAVKAACAGSAIESRFAVADMANASLVAEVIGLETGCGAKSGAGLGAGGPGIGPPTPQSMVFAGLAACGGGATGGAGGGAPAGAGGLASIFPQ